MWSIFITSYKRDEQLEQDGAQKYANTPEVLETTPIIVSHSLIQAAAKFSQ